MLSDAEPLGASGETGVPLPSASTILAEVGAKVHAIRKEKGLTLAQLSKATSLSPAIVSQIERGLANPSFTTLAHLAHGLEIPLGRLFPDRGASGSPVVHRADRRDLTGVVPEVAGEANHELLTPESARSIQVLWVVTPPGSDTSGDPITHRGEEFGLILSGKKDVHVGDARYVLDVGDSITFDSTTPHWYQNPYDEECVAIWVNSPPIW